MSTKKYFVPAALMLIVALLLATSSSASPSQQSGGPVTTATNEATGALSYLAADPNNPIIVPGATGQGISAQDRAMAALDVYGPQFGLNNPNQELNTREVNSPDKGRTVTHYQQVYNGVPVMGGELVVNMTSGGGLLSINGEISPNLNVKTSPSISAGEAQVTALAIVAKAYGMSASDFTATSPELWIYDARLLIPSERPAELVWRMEVAHNNPGVPIFELVLVNAQDGGVPLHFNQIDNFLGEIYPYQQEGEDPTPTPTPTSEETTEAPTATATPISSPTPTLETTPTPTLEASPTPTSQETPTPTLEATPTSTTEASPTPTEEISTTPTLTPTPRAEDGENNSDSEPQANFGRGTVYYIKTTTDGGDNGNDCLSPANACSSINYVLGLASTDDTLRIAEGSYRRIRISKSIQILGGWDTSFTSRVGFSILDGEGVDRVIYIDGAYIVELDRLVIQNGHTNSNGGGILNSGYLTLTNSVVQDNVAEFDGGGIFHSNNATLNIENSAILNNFTGELSVGTGGAMLISVGTTVNLRNVTVSGNESNVNAGGIFNAGSLTLNNVTIANNTAPGDGGGLTSGSPGPVNMRNTIIADNSAPNGPDCWTPTSIMSSGYNLIENTTNCTISAGTGDQTGVDPQLAALTGTLGIHTIPSTSPAIDAGNPGTPGTGSTTCEADDQLGNFRPYDGDGIGGSRCDIGAYEYAIGIGIYSGSGQNTDPSTAFGNPLEAIVLDGTGQPVQGETVTFTAPASGASGTFSDSGTNVTTAVSNASGIATSAVFTANSTEASYLVAATSPNTTGQADFSLTNLGSLAADLSTHDSNNTSTLPGTFLCDESLPLCTGGTNPDADKAHDYANDTYLFYLNHFGRDSIDGADMQIISSVLYDDDPGDGTPFTNAFWSGSLQQMVYGNGGNYAQADDVVGHELTHGVTDFESNLFYYYQSGAINEALSDIFGEFVDLTNGKGDDSAGVRWLQGEDSSVGALRDMQNPPTYNDPDKISSSFYYEGDAEIGYSGDNGGVHTNSGVVNKAAYLLTDGDTFNSYTVTGLGIDKVAAIFYETQTNLLTTASDFFDLYYLLSQACQNLIGGAEGITAGDCTEVQDAVDAVELNLQPATNYNPHAAEVCPSGQSVNDLFLDDFESGLGNWTATWRSNGSPAPGSVAADYWSTQSVYATGGSNALWGSDYTFYDGPPIDDDADDYAFEMNSSVSLPYLHSAYLHFEHAFGFENDDWDGGWIEYNTGGNHWEDIGSLFSDGLDYNGTINNTWDNLNPDHQAFVGDSHGYVSTRFSLDTLQNENVRIRLRISKDSIGYDLGWFVDNLRIYTCGDPPVPPETQSPTGTVTIPDPDFTWAEGEVGATYFEVQIQNHLEIDLYKEWHENTGSLCTAGSCTIDPGLTLFNGDYRWRVRPWSASYTTAPWSSFMNFTVDVPPPVLLDPLASDNPHGVTPSFSWEPLVGETWYQLYVTPSGGGTPVIDGTWHDANVVCSGSTCSVDPGLTFAEGSYTWDVVTYAITYDYPSEDFIVSLGPPEMAVEYSSTEIVDGDSSPSTGDGTDFGDVDVSSGTVMRSFDILNSGTGILSLSGTPIVDISGCGDFSVSTQPASSSVAASGSVAFELTYDPSSTGACNATVSIANNDSDENPYTFSVQGNGTVAPEISVKYDANDTEIVDGDTSPDTADGTDFGDVDITSGAVSQLFDIWNDGGAVLNLTGTPDVTVSGCTDFSITSQPVSSTVAAGGNSVQFELSFDPSSTGACNAEISIANDDSDENPYNFFVQGNGTELPKLISPIASGNPHGVTPSFSWDETPGETWYQLFVWDAGATPVINGTWHDAGVVCSGSTCSVDPGLTFAEGSYTWDVVNYKVSNDYAIASFVVSLGPPEMAVEYNATEIADGDSSPSTGDGTDFGDVDVSSGTVMRSFDILNSGTGILSLSGTPIVDISGCADFSVSTQPASSSVAASGSVAFELTYDPSSTGACSAEISIANNDADEHPYNFSVQGNGTVAPEISLEYNSTEIVDGDSSPEAADGTDFGDVDINSGASARSFTILNNGGAVLNLTGTPDVTVSGCADFSITTQPASSTVAAGGGSVTFELSFDPSSTGACNAEVSIANDDSDENPYNFSVQGNGTDTPKLISPANSSTLTSDNSPAYQWDETPGSTYYLLSVDGTSGNRVYIWYAVGTGVTCPGGICSVTPDVPLPNDDYTWTVQPYGPGGYGSFYPTFNFTVSLPLPVLVAPADASTITNDSTPAYQWEETTGATYYLLKVDGTSGNLINTWYAVGSGVTCTTGTCSVTPNTILPNDDYSWIVQPWGAGIGYGSFYSSFSFTMNVPPPPQPLLSTPADASTLTIDNTPEYQWEETTGATWYLLKVDSTSGNVVSQWFDATVCSFGTCSANPSNPLTNGDYNWTVQPYGPGGYGSFYPAFNFTVNLPLPVLVAPADTSTVTNNNAPLFQWEETTGATYYLLKVDGTSGNVVSQWFASTVCVAGTCSATSSKSLPNDDYTWTVQPWGAGIGYGSFYATFSFSMNVPPPALLSPSDSSGTSDTTPEYQWIETNGATWYLLTVDGTGGNVINTWLEVSAGVTCVGGTCSATPATVLALDTYTWTVQPYSAAAGYGANYTSFSFTVAPPP